MKIWPKPTPARLLVWSAVALAAAGGVLWMTVMPGKRVNEPLPEPTAEERALAGRLEADVRALAGEIGERNMHTGGTLETTAGWIVRRMEAAGYRPERHPYTLTGESVPRYAGREAVNLVAELPGTQRPGDIVIVGAHYDSVPGSPGADDNASSVAVLLRLAEAFAGRPQPRTLRFVAFTNEEQPFYLSKDMGSMAYARQCRERGEHITAMMSMDGLGYFDTQPGSQHYPVAGIGMLYPDTADFIAFVTRVRDAGLLRRALKAFRADASIPSEGAALPGFVAGVGWSDHWSFWQHDYPAFLVTDTLPFRYRHYHGPGDTPGRLDYGRMARVAYGLRAVVERLAE